METVQVDRTLHCYAHGRGSAWEAICVDLDIAVNGRSHSEVKTLLEAAIKTYIEDAKAEGDEVAARLLSRRSPWHVRARLALGVILYKVRASLLSPDDRERTSNFSIPCRA